MALLISVSLAACSVFPGKDTVPSGEPWPAQGQIRPRGDEPSAFVIARAQLLLTDLGYRPGAADGVVDGYTEAAVRAFQMDRELSADGRIGAALLAELEVAHRALTVRRAQARLSALGYDPGPIDGAIGPRTRAAISIYEQERGMPVTGDVTPPLLQRLQGDQTVPLAQVPEPPPAQKRTLAVGQAARSDGGDPKPADDAAADVSAASSLESAPTDLEAAEPFEPLFAADQEEQVLAAASVAPQAGAVGAVPNGPERESTLAALPPISIDGGHGSGGGKGPQLRPGDRVRLTIGNEGADVIERDIDNQGRLDLPGGLSVEAAGLTMAELQKTITMKLVESFIEKLSVDVSRPQTPEASQN